MAELLGVFREAPYSPGRVEDDAAILARTSEALRARGHTLTLCDADALIAAPPLHVDGVLAMCQHPRALAVLDQLAARVPVMNSARAIRNCHRRETVRLLQDAAVPFPRTTIVSTAAPRGTTGTVGTPCWVKRGDVHAMATADVVFAASDDALTDALASFAARGIDTAALQEHVDGPVLKFYAVTDGSFFRAFGEVPEAPAAVDALWSVACAGAAALGLDVFGGDLVIAPHRGPILIDINDWPSFARCRDEAADAIATYAAARVVHAAREAAARSSCA